GISSTETAANVAQPAVLPPLMLDDQSGSACAPTVFIGIGGAATRTLRKLRQRLHDRLGSLDELPAVTMLLLDTDVKSLNQAVQGPPGAALAGHETLALPLRRSQDYRHAAADILGW